MKHIIAYQGPEYTVEWFFDKRGYSQAWQHFVKLSKEQQRKILILFRLVADHGKIYDAEKFREEGEGIYIFRPQPDRTYCCFIKKNKIIVTHVFCKKNPRLPPEEKEMALLAYDNYESRTIRGEYYEEL